MDKVRRWLRAWRLLSLRTAVVTLLALYVITGVFVVPSIVKRLIVDKVRELTGREVALAEVRCNPLTLSLTVRGFSMPDRPGTTLLAFDELYVNLQASSLLRWAPTLKELRLENPFVALRRFADGKINVVELVEEIRRRVPADAEAATAEEAGPTGLPRLLLQHVLVTGSALQIEDQARAEPLTLARGPARFELRDVSTLPGRKGVHEFVIGLKRGGTIRVNGDVVLEPLGLSGTVAVDQWFLDATWSILKPYFGFDVTAGRAAARFRYSVRAPDGVLQARLEGLDCDLRGLVLQRRDSEVKVLEIEKLAIRDGHLAWPEGDVGAAEVGVNGASAFVWREPDGSFSWEALVPKDTRTEVVHTYRKVEQALPWTATVGRFEVKDSSAAFEDRTFDEPVRLAATVANLELRDVTTAPGGRWSLTASVSLPGGGATTLDGVVGTGPLRLDLTVAVRDLGIDPVNPYLARLAPLSLRGGRVEASGTVHVPPGGEGAKTTFRGDLTIHDIDLLETAVGSSLLKWDHVDLRGIEAASAPQSLRIAEVGIHGAGVEVVVAEDGRVNVNELLAAVHERSEEPQQDAGAVETAAGGAAAGRPAIEIGTLALHGCSAAYTDRRLAPPFTFALEPIDGTIRAISTRGAAGAKLKVDGAVRSGGGFEVAGEMDVLDPARFTDLTAGLRHVELPPASALATRYLGYPLERGWIDVALDYDIVASKLAGQNRFVTQDLTLGDKIEGQGITGVPVELGVSLLDRQGREDHARVSDRGRPVGSQFRPRQRARRGGEGDRRPAREVAVPLARQAWGRRGWAGPRIRGVRGRERGARAVRRAGATNDRRRCGAASRSDPAADGCLGSRGRRVGAARTGARPAPRRRFSAVGRGVLARRDVHGGGPAPRQPGAAGVALSGIGIGREARSAARGARAGSRAGRRAAGPRRSRVLHRAAPRADRVATDRRDRPARARRRARRGDPCVSRG